MSSPGHNILLILPVNDELLYSILFRLSFNVDREDVSISINIRNQGIVI